MKKFILLALIALFVVISTVGCNAARGVGKDLQDTGKHVSDIGK